MRLAILSRERNNYSTARLVEAARDHVPTLHRDHKVIPNPRSGRDLRGGDRLLCFGTMESMRHLVPERTRRRRRPQAGQLPETPE